MPIEVRPARKSDVRELSRVLGRAFYDDPVSVWMLPADETRAGRLASYFATVTRHHHLPGGGVEVACAGPVIGAATLWDPPHRWKQSGRARLSMLPALIGAYRWRLGAGRIVEELLDAAHPREPHWYLAVIGSDPTVRGGGFGKAVLQSRLVRCDAERCPAYLESSKFDNVPYYQRFGFEVTGTITIPGGPTLWQMWRQPR